MIVRKLVKHQQLMITQLNATEARIQDATARYDLQDAAALLEFTIGANDRPSQVSSAHP